MLAEQECQSFAVSRRDVEAKPIECRHSFRGVLRKRQSNPLDAEEVFRICVKVLRELASIRNGDRLNAWPDVTSRHTLTDHNQRQASRKHGTPIRRAPAGHVALTRR